MSDYTHGSTEVELQPDDQEVMQTEHAPGLQCIPVTVEEPVRTVELPAKSGGSRRYVASLTTPQRVLGRDPRRKSAVIELFDVAGLSRGIFYGTSQNEVNPPSSYAARLALAPAAAVPTRSAQLHWDVVDELWMIADTAVCDVSVTAAQWAD
jgi:hypothetical protein